MASSFRSSNSNRRSFSQSKITPIEKINEVSQILNGDEETESSNREILKFNENTYSFARILNQVVEKVCDDVETRLGRLEERMNRVEAMMMEKERKSQGLHEKENMRGENKVIKDDGLNERLECLEENLSSLKSELILRQGQVKKMFELQKDRVSDEIRIKIEEIRRESFVPEHHSLKEIKKSMEKLRQSIETEEIRGENQMVNIRRMEDDLVRVVAGMKELNEIRLTLKVHSNEIDRVRTDVRELIGGKRGRSHHYTEK